MLSNVLQICETTPTQERIRHGGGGRYPEKRLNNHIGDSVRDFHIDGIVPIIPTPFLGDDRPDWESLRGLVDFAHAAGACAICLPAYASEFYKLSEDERREALARAIEY